MAKHRSPDQQEWPEVAVPQPCLGPCPQCGCTVLLRLATATGVEPLLPPLTPVVGDPHDCHQALAAAARAQEVAWAAFLTTMGVRWERPHSNIDVLPWRKPWDSQDRR